VKDTLGAPSFVFYNSTSSIAPDAKFAATPRSDFDNSINTDVIGAYVVSKEALEHFSKQKQGTLVFGNSPASKGEIGILKESH
jgi:NAD(P)-dependent dehydrogenase (short-subunit alcohol dehydrogenase family)